MQVLYVPCQCPYVCWVCSVCVLGAQRLTCRLERLRQKCVTKASGAAARHRPFFNWGASKKRRPCVRPGHARPGQTSYWALFTGPGQLGFGWSSLVWLCPSPLRFNLLPASPHITPFTSSVILLSAICWRYTFVLFFILTRCCVTPHSCKRPNLHLDAWCHRRMFCCASGTKGDRVTF